MTQWNNPVKELGVQYHLEVSQSEQSYSLAFLWQTVEVSPLITSPDPVQLHRTLTLQRLCWVVRCLLSLALYPLFISISRDRNV